MSETNIGPMSGTGPSFVSMEPDASLPRAPEALMCVNKAAEGGEGASGAGSQALVRRFSDSSGAALLVSAVSCAGNLGGWHAADFTAPPAGQRRAASCNEGRRVLLMKG